MKAEGKNFLVALIEDSNDESFNLNVFDNKEEAIAYGEKVFNKMKLKKGQSIVVVRTDETEFLLDDVLYHMYKGWTYMDQKKKK